MHHEHSAASALCPTVTNVFITRISNDRRRLPPSFHTCKWQMNFQIMQQLHIHTNVQFVLLCSSNANNNNNYPVGFVRSFLRNSPPSDRQRIWRPQYTLPRCLLHSIFNILLSCSAACGDEREREHRPLITYAVLVIFCSCLFKFMAGDGRQQKESSTNFINISFSSAIIRGPYDLACACVAGALLLAYCHDRTDRLIAATAQYVFYIAYILDSSPSPNPFTMRRNHNTVNPPRGSNIRINLCLLFCKIHSILVS